MVIESLGGYRLVRKLGEGERAEVFLAHPHSARPDAVPSVVKIFRPEVGNASIAQEIEALSRGAGDHIIQLLDLTTAPSGMPALILSRCSTGSVSKLISTRPVLGLGEAITILAPLAATLARLHDQGVVHCSIRPEAILFDSAGAPTIGCFGLAQLVGIGLSDAGHDADPRFGHDLGAMKQLAITVLRRVSSDEAVPVLDWLELREPKGPGWLSELGEQLFRLGEPQAIDLRPCVAQGMPAAFPLRLTVASPPTIRSRRSPGVKPTQRSSVLAEFVSRILPDGLLRGLSDREAAALDGSVGPPVVRDAGIARRVTTYILDAAKSIRRRFWITGGLIAVALVAAIIIVPAPASSPTVHPPALSVANPEGTSAPTTDEAVDDDPVRAALALLQQRERCFRTMSVICLDDVVQAGSAASDADITSVREIQDGGEAPPPLRVNPSEMVMTERLGDTALIRLGSTADDEPASLLLLKSEAGWRIRTYLAH